MVNYLRTALKKDYSTYTRTDLLTSRLNQDNGRLSMINNPIMAMSKAAQIYRFFFCTKNFEVLSLPAFLCSLK